jgi:hypothetical protein
MSIEINILNTKKASDSSKPLEAFKELEIATMLGQQILRGDREALL